MTIEQQSPHFDCSAAIIDLDGREVPITEQMIQEACRQLEGMAPWPQQACTNLSPAERRAHAVPSPATRHALPA